jgi:hypothetical protein
MWWPTTLIPWSYSVIFPVVIDASSSRAKCVHTPCTIAAEEASAARASRR